MRWGRMFLAAVVLAGAALAYGGDEPAFKPKGPLEGLPSKAEGAHIEKLKALGDNSWLDLGSPAPDPKWGKARGRAWTPKMAYAPELRGAFFCATGVHGFVKPDGHYMDDLWLYDINAHRWVCIYPGADTKVLKMHLDKNGFEINEAGEHIPVSYLSHGYNNLTYNPDLHKYMVIETECPWWTSALPQRWEWLDQKYPAVATKNYGGVGDVIRSAKHPWFWDGTTGKWDRKFIAGAGPGRGRFEGVLEYVPAQKRAYYLYSHGEVWIYDFGADTWSAAANLKLPATGNIADNPIYDSAACFDPKRERIWVGVRKSFGYYDTKNQAWTAVKAKNQPAELGGGNDSHLTYDSVNDLLVLTLRRSEKDWATALGTYVYNPAEDAWTAEHCPLPKVPAGFSTATAFYDPETNAHFCFFAPDSGDNGTMFAYRYKNAKR